MKRQDRKLAMLMVSQPSSSTCDEAGGTDPEQEVRPSKDAVCPDPVKEYQDREGLTDPEAANRSDEPDGLSRSGHHTYTTKECRVEPGRAKIEECDP